MHYFCSDINNNIINRRIKLWQDQLEKRRKDAERFVEEMKRVESLTTEQRKANREKLQAEIAVLYKEWNLTYNALRG